MDQAGAIDPEREPIRKVSHGARANYTGNSLEEFVHNTLIRKGYKFVEHRQFDAERFLDRPIFTVHYPVARSIYDTQLFCDFLIFHPDKHAARKLQTGCGGSQQRSAQRAKFLAAIQTASRPWRSREQLPWLGLTVHGVVL
jgi:hypothetical protein